MPTYKDLYYAATDDLTNVINRKAGTTGKKDIPLMLQAAESIKSIEDGTLPSQAAQTITPTANDQTIAAGKYLAGEQTIEGIVCENLTAENIKKDVVVKVGTSTDDDSVLSITGLLEGGEVSYAELLTDTYGSGATPTPTNYKYVEVVSLSASDNGTYNAPENTAYDPVTVSVSGGGGGTQPQLNAPSIAMNGTTVQITDSTNGNFVSAYQIFVDGILTYTTSTKSYNLSAVTSNTATITVKASGENFRVSPSSNEALYRRGFTVRYYDNTTLLKTSTILYEGSPSYVPTKSGYVFVEWVDSNGNEVISTSKQTQRKKLKRSIYSLAWM